MKDVIRSDLKGIEVDEGEWYGEATTSRAAWQAIYRSGIEDRLELQRNSTLTRWSANSVCGSSEERAIESGISVLQRGESLSVSNTEPYNARLVAGGLEAVEV